MKGFVFIISMLCATSVFAQDLDAYIKMMQSDISQQKVTIITQNMLFTEKEAEKFWKIYKDYDKEVQAVSEKRYAIIKEFADNYLNMTDEKAEKLMEDALKYRQTRLQLKLNLWNTLKNKISPAKAAKFIQLENQMQLLIDVQIAAELPLIEKTAIE